MAFVLTRRLQPVRGLLDLVPAVTVVLLLLIFFLLSSSLVLQPGIKIDPPRSVAAIGTPLTRLKVGVAMAPVTFDANGVALPRQATLYFDDQIVTLEGLRRALDRLPPSRVAPALVLEADKDVPIDLMTRLMDLAFAHRLAVVIATQAPVPPAP